MRIRIQNSTLLDDQLELGLSMRKFYNFLLLVIKAFNSLCIKLVKRSIAGFFL